MSVGEEEGVGFEVERYSVTESTVLEALATYRYMTAGQMVRVGVSKSLTHLRGVLRKLQKKRPALIVGLDFGVQPGEGKLPRMHALTPYGADVLEEMHGGSVTFAVSKKVRMFRHDYAHRRETVDILIAFRQWSKSVGADVDFVHTYYDPRRKRDGKLAPCTRVVWEGGWIDADAVFNFTMPDGAGRLCALEVCRGRRTKELEQKLDTYLKAVSQAAFETTFAAEHEVRALLVFSEERALELMKKRVGALPYFKEFQTVFFIKTLDEVGDDFLNNWQHFNGHRVPLFS